MMVPALPILPLSICCLHVVSIHLLPCNIANVLLIELVNRENCAQSHASKIIAHILSPTYDIVDYFGGESFSPVPLILFSLTGAIYILWGSWTFILIPILRPHSPRELPYVIPGEFLKGSAARRGEGMEIMRLTAMLVLGRGGAPHIFHFC